MQFDFTLGAYQSQQLDVQGKFFRLASAAGTVRVKTNTGETIDLEPGQGVWNVDFQWLSVQDRTGSQNDGTILAGGFDFHDDRITGTVDVVDGGKSRTRANQSFMCCGYRAAAAGLISHFQFFNPPGSGRNVYVEQIMVQTATANANVNYGWGSAVLNTDVSASFSPVSKRSSSNVESVIQVYGQDNAAPMTGYLLGSMPGNAILPLKEPLLIEPGYGLIFRGNGVNQDLSMEIEYFEEPI